ncbi:MAG: DUF1624 domain-containing protein [Winogradskyella sp.]|uniref:heparan-alpha-glucosaminide N-acetyltransferase domain-containing protein n=1 Tax=Winogradskyella sp. TaxID=1883156 RepID=UPI001833C7BF|nr:DUF1624 domain-containing protein [Winogradskyella sp.]
MSTTKRLYFIDAVRAFAILMMLQGHFIDTLMDVSYRDESSVIFNCWKYFRGITAPTFFTISGLIFTYLLIKAKHKGLVNQRIRKGITRGLMLIGIGYALRLPILQWLAGNFSNSFFVVDVLQCIGLSLILIVLIYKILLTNTTLFSLLMVFSGTFIFITEPYYRSLDLGEIPLILSNYISKADGSIFTIIPWFGYVCYGAFLATLFYKYLERPKFKMATIVGLLIIGMLLIHYSSWFFMQLYFKIDFELLKDVAYFNYLFTRLGNVLVLFALFYLVESLIKQPLILKIGQKTLSIYIIHFIVIYGSFTGLGLNKLIGRALIPWEAAIGALLFIVVVCIISFYYTRTNAYLYAKLRLIMEKIKS